MCWRDEYWRWLWPLLGKKWRVLCNCRPWLGPCYHDMQQHGDSHVGRLDVVPADLLLASTNSHPAWQIQGGPTVAPWGARWAQACGAQQSGLVLCIFGIKVYLEHNWEHHFTSSYLTNCLETANIINLVIVIDDWREEKNICVSLCLYICMCVCVSIRCLWVMW